MENELEFGNWVKVTQSEKEPFIGTIHQVHRKLKGTSKVIGYTVEQKDTKEHIHVRAEEVEPTPNPYSKT